jgi:4-diphosphocytidyl-2-C-methyl-D-erythritol kinase
VIREPAPAKVNLVLHVGRPRADGLHPLCSLFASLDLVDEVTVEEADADSVRCPDVPGDNLASRALAAYRRAAAAGPPPLAVTIEKRIPVAAGLGGGSADAAAVLRAADALAAPPLGAHRLRRVAAELGSDVPSQVEPRHALVTGTGEQVEPVELPGMATVLVPQSRGLSSGEVYAELDRLGGGREHLDPDALRRLAAAPLGELAGGVENDLEPAALSLRPELGRSLAALRDAGALAAAISGSGPTAFGVFANGAAAELAARGIEGAVVAGTRAPA